MREERMLIGIFVMTLITLVIQCVLIYWRIG